MRNMTYICKYFFSLAAILMSITMPALAQRSGIEIPATNDKYSHYVTQLENGKTDIDYTDFRNSFLESRQSAKKGNNYDTLKKQVRTAVKNQNYQEVIQATKAMLSIDYTSMFAHKYLQQTYKILGDTVNCKKYHDIELGLLNSIVKSGDGKSCETAWHVTQIEEEYFILSMIDAHLEQQSLIQCDKNSCDKMEVKLEHDVTKTYYFEVNMVLEKEGGLMGK